MSRVNSRRPPVLLAAAALAWASFAVNPRAALAQVGDIPTTQSEPPGSSSGVDIATKLPYWGAGDSRAFVAASFDAGVIFYRTTLMAGYGKPHWSWVGAEGNAVISPDGGSFYGGIRGTLPEFEVRVGFRQSFTISEFVLPPQDTYTVIDMDYENTVRSRYWAFEAETTGSIGVPGGRVYGAATLYAIFNEPEGYYLFEEVAKVIMAPPYLFRLRGGYIAQPTWEGTMKVGVIGEVLGDPGRGIFHVRAGPALSVALTHHLDVTGALFVTISSPDSIGLRGADLGSLSLRYKWATGDKWPEFP
ncbi:MAG: hypothetical protein HUU21_17000 [Polyangiaceae bacterium]|nr:hypothetical protein [Polyangiaceae bacterium]